MKLTIRGLRNNMGWTQEEASKYWGVTPQTIRSYETCKTFPPIKVINKIIETTGIDYNDIIFLPKNDAQSVEK